MSIGDAPVAGGRPWTLPFLCAASLLSILMGFRLGMNPQDVGYGLQAPGPGLDRSYTYAMNRASAEGHVFGREFVSTYGPFGYVIAAMNVPGIVIPWIVAQLLLTTAVGLAASAYAVSFGRGLGPTVAATLLLLVPVHVLADEYRWLSLVLLLVLLGLRFRARTALAVLATTSLVAGFSLLVKLSLGSGALLTVVAASLVARPRRACGLRLIVACPIAATGLGLGWWLHQGSFVGLPDYLATAASVTSGYSSAMSLADPAWWKVCAAFGVFVVCLVAALLAPGRPDLRVVAGALAAPLFVAWKHGVVRQDGHVQILALFGLVIAAIALVEIAGASGLGRASPWLLLGAVALSRVWLECPHGTGPLPALREALLRPLAFPGGRSLSALTSLSVHLTELERESTAALAPLRLSDSDRQLIGSQPMDVYPWEAAYVAANGFNWSSRPSPASFATYTPALDRRNAAFFMLPSRPPFVLWHPTGRSIDRRHLFWDEPLTFRALLAGYDLASRGEVLVLRARSQPRFGLPERLQTVDVEWGEALRLPRVRGGALLAEVAIGTPFPALVRRVLLREDPAYVAVRFDNGERVRFRYLPDQARSGLWMWPLPRNSYEVAALLEGTCPPTLVEEVRFLGGFRPSARGARITFWRLPVVAGPAFDCGGD
jgi:hypothetical protein